MAAWNPKANDIFLQALEIEPGERRRIYLEGACRGDSTLCGQVESLLAASERAGNFLEQPAAGTNATVGFGLSEAPGSSIGPYKLLQKLGEGGMGIVWAAQQTEPVKRKVALKVIKPGMDSAQVLRRFEAERQALALMDHSNIAKVLDAGTVGQAFQPDAGAASQAGKPDLHGRPYFVMELVKGVPITKYCDELHLPLRERLALFVPVCQAAQHAHQKGIIHRDIKPSNVLIAMQDGKPVPKVIDFGVAKALHQKLTEHTMNTEIGQVMGTLEYMSPEQAELSPLDIDTRTDIYALGVLLYELLTGTTPLDHQRLKRAGYAEVLRLIREVEPPKPSTRLSESKESLAALAAQRRTEPARLTKDVRGELDWIVMKCLEKDRTRRYETANALVRDIERHLNDEPVEACPPSRGYRLSKFLRRHKGPVAAAALVLLSLLGGEVGTTLGLVEARRQRDAADLARANEADERAKAEAQREAARQAQANAERERTRAEALQQAEERQREQAEENLRRANENFAKAEENLRMAQASFDLARRAVDHYLTKVGSDERLAEAGLVGLRKELLADAKEFYQEFVRAHDDDPNLLTDLAWAYFRMGYISDQAGAPQEAQENYRAATEAFDRLHDWAATLHEKWHVERKIDLGWLKFSWTHDFSKGVNREAEFANAMAKCYNNVGTVHYAAREWEQAEAAFRKAEALNRPLAAEQPNEAMFL
ncbi:MAG TPA: serine/threonine-protein kinase, partial [Pirellulales bacterium]|nr:serine/threonine-protein kinase [Pirellulales bacterium]